MLVGNPKKPKYPRKYRKVTPDMKTSIRAMYLSGIKQIEIARYFGLSSPTITKTVHERSRLISIANSRKHTREYIKNPEYRARINEAIRKNVKKRYHHDKKYKKFLLDYSVYDKQNRKDYLKKYHRDYYLRKKEEDKQLLKRKIWRKANTNGAKPNRNKKNGGF